MDNKPQNPHQTKYNDANAKALGFSSGKDNLISHARDWDKNYELDLIGREYCRDRQIPVSKSRVPNICNLATSKRSNGYGTL